MLETFLILLAGGVMLAVVVSDPKQVTLNWLRLAGILALSFAALAAYWYASRNVTATPELRRAANVSLVGALSGIVLQLGFVQVARRNVQRVSAGFAVIGAIAAGAILLRRSPSRAAIGEAIAPIGVAAVLGITLMDMLLGHAYLTASKMTMAPFRRLNLWLAGALAFRAICSLVVAHSLNQAHPVDRLWPQYGLLIGTRWLVGLALPAVFVYMARDCIQRRSTQSATGILFVALVLVLIGEIIALNLVRDTGLPF